MYSNGDKPKPYKIVSENEKSINIVVLSLTLVYHSSDAETTIKQINLVFHDANGSQISIKMLFSILAFHKVPTFAFRKPSLKNMTVFPSQSYKINNCTLVRTFERRYSNGAIVIKLAE